jgi:putative ABC transport system permease protein
MKELFGLQTSSIMMVLLIVLGVALASVAFIAIRRPVIFKLGVRNIPRRKAQTALTIIGLMLSTMIISAAFGTGDTLDYSLTSAAYNNLGHVDELVVSSRDVNAKNVDPYTTVPVRTLDLIQQTLADNPDVDGVMPILDVRAPVEFAGAGLSEPEVVLTGLDPALVDQFGGLQSTNGDSIDLASFPAGSVVLSERVAKNLEANVGDTVQIRYNNAPAEFTVAAIAKDSHLSGVRVQDDGSGFTPGLAMPLQSLQQLTGINDAYTAIAISNTGGVRNDLDLTDAVEEALYPVLQGQNLGVDPIKDNRVDQAVSASNLYTGLFLVFGLFSIAVGVLLIVLIFSMLAAERRAEMGMERAIGAQRRQLIQQFISEGTTYAIFAGLVGVSLGVAAAAVIAAVLKPIGGDGTTITWHVTSTGVIVSYCLGVAITFLSVVIASWRISRLNVVSAIRDIPEATTLHRNRRSIVFGSLFLVLGTAFTALGAINDIQAVFRLGISMLPFGVALVARFFGVPSRPVFTGVGLYLLFIWLLPTGTFEAIFGKQGEGDFELFFLSGIFLVFAVSILVVQNGDVLLRAVGLIGGLLKSKIASFRTAIAYPSAAPVRTGMTISMFCLVVFALVMVSSMSTNFVNYLLGDKADAGWSVRVDTTASNPITDFNATLQNAGIDTSNITGIGTTTSPSANLENVRVNGETDWKFADITGMNDAYLTESDLSFRNRAARYDSDAAILEALRTQPNVAVVSEDVLDGGGGFGPAGDDLIAIGDIESDTQGFQPVVIDVAVPNSDEVRQITVIGVIDPQIGTLTGIMTNQTTIDAIYPTVAETHYFLALNDESKDHEVATAIESSLSANGAQAVAISDELDDARSQSRSFFSIAQGFMGLGLVVGIAAIGVIAYRSVVERRQQIGVLRALGYQSSEVALSFLIETIYVVTIGVVSGAVLGLILARNLFKGDELGTEGANFTVPWLTVSVTLVATVIVALLMTWAPARQASRIAPAEALRYE